MSILQTYPVQSKRDKKHEAVVTSRTKTKHGSTVEQLAAITTRNRDGTSETNNCLLIYNLLVK